MGGWICKRVFLQRGLHSLGYILGGFTDVIRSVIEYT